MAAESLASGADVGAVVLACGYYDEPHLARALRRYVGRTAGQLRSGLGGAIALSSVDGERPSSRESAHQRTTS